MYHALHGVNNPLVSIQLGRNPLKATGAGVVHTSVNIYTHSESERASERERERERERESILYFIQEGNRAPVSKATHSRNWEGPVLPE